MEWNDGKERAKFAKEEAKLREQYLAAGMTEEQIEELYEFDLVWYRSCRREAQHTQALDIQTGEDEDRKMENPLYKKFFEKLAREDDPSYFSHLGWLEEIQDERLYAAIRSLPEADLELLTKYAILCVTNKDLATLLGVSHQAITGKISKIRKILRKALAKQASDLPTN